MYMEACVEGAYTLVAAVVAMRVLSLFILHLPPTTSVKLS